MSERQDANNAGHVELLTITREWGRIGCLGFGGPPSHIALLRRLCVEDRRWISAEEFEDGVAACNLLPGPASTQLSIFCAWKLRGVRGALLGGACFIAPGLLAILVLSAVFLAKHPPQWILGAAAGAGAAVPAIAVAAASRLAPSSWRGAGPARSKHVRWVLYALAAGSVAASAGTYVALALIACGVIEVIVERSTMPTSKRAGKAGFMLAGHSTVAVGGLLALAWVAFKVGALSYGGGFVIVPLMQHDAVTTYHWVTGPQFLNAVALGQVTPGPVTLTVAAVGYAAKGIVGALLATVVAFTPSFLFVLLGAPRFDRLRRAPRIRAFLSGAGPAAIGAIAGSAIPLGVELAQTWQLVLLALAAVWLLALRRGVVSGIVGAAVAGVLATALGAPLTH